MAEEAAGALMAALFDRLTSALAEGPPEHALDVCGSVAQEIGASVREKTGVDVRRTSLKVRNPKNGPDAWEEAWLRAAESRKDIPPAGEAHVVGKEFRFVRPVYVAELCAKCHGPEETLRPQVVAALKERYPDDRATGYAPGDLRGIVSVRVRLE